MTWGRDTDEHEAREQLAMFQDVGGNLVDTADVYADGAAEKILGRLLAEDHRRDGIVLATKSVSRPGTERRFDASRRHLLAALDGSLRRLGVDCIDLWQLHAWDPWTPIDETLSAVDSAIAAGKVRYAGVSNYSGWQVAQAATLQSNGSNSNPLVSVQVEYSLVQRGVEREVIPASEALGLGVLPWSPLGRGTLTGKYRNGTPAESRAANPTFSSFIQPYLGDGGSSMRCAPQPKVSMLNHLRSRSRGCETNLVSAHRFSVRGLPLSSRWAWPPTTWNFLPLYEAH